MFGANGQVSSSAYLKLGMDARGIAVGRAYTALASGAAAIYWNPAGILMADPNEQPFDFNLTNMLNSPWDVNYLTGSFAWRRTRVGLATGYIRYQVADIPEYNDAMDYLGNFQNVEQAGLIGFALDFPGLFSVGMTGYYLTQEYQYLTGSTPIQGWGLNLGLKMYPLLQYKQLEMGILLHDNKTLKAPSNPDYQDTTSLIFNAGLKWIAWQSDAPYFGSVTLLGDFEQEKNYPIKLKFGTEVLLADFKTTTLYLRGGIDDLILRIRPLDSHLTESTDALKDQITRLNRKFTLGIGLQHQLYRTQIIVDYAWVKETFRELHFLTIKFSL